MDHPYQYGRVIDIFHIKCRHRGPKSLNSLRIHTFNVLFVRWFELDKNYQWGFQAKRLPRIYFPTSTSPSAFGFLDPARVIRGVHIMPAYSLGTTEALLPADSVARRIESGDEGEIEAADWNRYYVGM